MNKSEPSVLTMSQQELNQLIMTQIFETHAHANIEFDVHSLFNVVKKILNRTSAVVQKVVLGNKLEIMEEEPPTGGLGILVSTLKQLYYEMACKPLGEEVEGKKILEKLSNYSWDAKAVVTLAAFAFDYGDFWLLAHLYSTDKNAKLVGILKGVPTIVTDSWLQKHKREIIQLDQLINSTLDAIDCILQLEDLSDRYAQEDLPELSEAMYSIPLEVYYAIKTVVACTTQMNFLIDNNVKPPELSDYTSRIKATYGSLKVVIDHTKKIIEELDAYRKLIKIMKNPRKISVVIDNMRFTPSLQVDDIKEWETMCVFLFISGLDICENDIYILNSFNDKISSKDQIQYKIIWIPIVEDWNVKIIQTKFEKFRSKMPLTWHILPNYSYKLGIKYFRERWQFKNRPIVVVMSPHGDVVHLNAYHMMVLGIYPLAFQRPIPIGKLLFGWLKTEIQTWMDEEKYIFFYGGNGEWTKQFSKPEAGLATISVEFFRVEIGSKDISWKFWNRIESFFLGWNYINRSIFSESSTDKKTGSLTVMSTILKLLTGKTDESEWFVLCKGSELVDSGNVTTIPRVLKEFEKQKPNPPFDFAKLILEYHSKILKAETPGCYHIDMQEDADKITDPPVTCPFCLVRMKMNSRFTCCHSDYLPIMNAQK